MLDSGCCVPPVEGAAFICDKDKVEEGGTPIGPPAGLGVEEEGSRPVDRSGCVSVLTSSSSSSSSSSMLGQADWSSTRFRRSFRALSASCLECKGNLKKIIIIQSVTIPDPRWTLTITHGCRDPRELLTAIQQSSIQATDVLLALDLGSTNRNFWYRVSTYCGVNNDLS